jgi:hypothetical protein
VRMRPQSAPVPPNDVTPAFAVTCPLPITIRPRLVLSHRIPSSHNSVLARWRPGRRRIDLIAGTVGIRWLLELCSPCLLTTVVALVCSIHSLSLIVISSFLTISLILLIAISILGLLLVLLVLLVVLRVVRGSAVACGGVTNPSSAVKRLETPLATTAG